MDAIEIGYAIAFILLLVIAIIVTRMMENAPLYCDKCNEFYQGESYCPVCEKDPRHMAPRLWM